MQKLMIGLLTLACSHVSLGQFSGGYEITAHIPGIPNGAIVRAARLSYETREWSITKDSDIVINEKFHLSGTVEHGPQQYELWISTVAQPKEVWKAIRLAINNGEHLTINSPNINDIAAAQFIDKACTIEGSPSNLAWENFLSGLRIANQFRYSINNQITAYADSAGFNPLVVSTAMTIREHMLQLTDLMIFDEETRSRPIWTLSIACMATFYSHDSLILDAYNHLDEQQKNSYWGRFIKEKIKLCAGQPFPSFTLPTVDGRNIASKDLIAANKLTIVHFWATDSYKHKQFEDELRKHYQHYHNKGLEIIGVSSDRYAEQWKESLIAEQFPWPNVSDTKGEKGIVNTVYHEWGNPKEPNTTSVVIDAKGKIVAWDVYGAELQWYLWKYLGN